MTRTLAIIPVKELEETKTTFSEALSQEKRRELTLAMLKDVLKSIEEVETIEPAVLTPDEKVLGLAEEKEIKIIKEPGVGLNRSLEMAIGEVKGEG